VIHPSGASTGIGAVLPLITDAIALKATVSVATEQVKAGVVNFTVTTGAANKVISFCLEGRLQPVMGNTLFTEFEAVLNRTPLFAKSRLTAVEREELFNIFLSTCEWTKVYFQWRPNLRDESDNHLIELAVAAIASFVVTRNVREFAASQLLFPQILILTPEQILKEVTQ
jgi:predicted nucleic acid-binding protein